jgi:hypothetical protein
MPGSESDGIPDSRAALQAKGLAPGIHVATFSVNGSCVTGKLGLTD